MDGTYGDETDLRILKGGSWFTNNPYWLRPAFRYFVPAAEVSTAYGFRCARDTTGATNNPSP